MKWFTTLFLLILFTQPTWAATLAERERLLEKKLSRTSSGIHRTQSEFPEHVAAVAVQFETDLAFAGPSCKGVRHVGREAIEQLIKLAKDNQVQKLLRDMAFNEEIMLAYANAANGCFIRRFRLIFADKTVLTIDFR